MTTPRNSATRRARGGRTFARLATATAVAVLATGALTGVAGAVGSADMGSADRGPSADGPARTATTTHGNLSITREIVGNHTGPLGTIIKFRTTISALDAPVREITGISESWYNKSFLGFQAATVTYTAPTGDRVTDPAGEYSSAIGSWPVDATTGATVVYESTYKTENANLGIAMEADDPDNLRRTVSITATGLEPLSWNPPEVAAKCLDQCWGPQLFSSAS